VTRRSHETRAGLSNTIRGLTFRPSRRSATLAIFTVFLQVVGPHREIVIVVIIFIIFIIFIVIVAGALQLRGHTSIEGEGLSANNGVVLSITQYGHRLNRSQIDFVILVADAGESRFRAKQLVGVASLHRAAVQLSIVPKSCIRVTDIGLIG
jgi:hypothetical protein